MEWYTLAIISAAFSSASAILEKKNLLKSDALGFSFILSLYTALFTLPLGFMADFSTLDLTIMCVMIIKSIMDGAAFFYVMKGLRELEISGALPYLVLTPGIVTILLFLIFGDSLAFFEIMGMVLLVTGTYLLQVNLSKGIFYPFKILIKKKGYLNILMALGIFTASALLDRIVLGKYKLPSLTYVFIYHSFIFLFFLSLVIIRRRLRSSMREAGRFSIWIILAAGTTLIYRFTEVEAMRLYMIPLVLSLKRLSVFFSTVIGGKLFKDKELLKKSIATFIIVSGAVLIIIGKTIR